MTNNWKQTQIKDLLDYERPDAYIVKSTNYVDTGYPVLTANKSFILGYTTESEGVYNNLPAIIFDDFTTDCKYVDFPFKVKSSAIKILKAKNPEIDLKFVFELMKSLTFPVGDHKRYYISQYQNLAVDVPTFSIQKRISQILSSLDEAIQKTDQIIQKTETLKQGLIQTTLRFGKKENIRYLALKDIGKVSMCKRIFKDETSDNGDIPFYKIGTFGKEPDAYISKELYDGYRSKYPYPKIGDVLLSASGTIGRKVKYDGRPAYFQDSNIVWLEHDESKILNDFLFYLYDTIKWQTEGSTIKRLYNDILLRKVVPVPSIEMQKQILRVLLAVDEKIKSENIHLLNLWSLKKGLMHDIFSQKVQIN